ncbi:MAG: MerR family DNA-binding protein [Planctomycetes bacterium]|jgi:MerR family transcriptional regulator, copper efflux regulator|nr:MerR family DNA-binding protein [Planctomycetota bacterium]
MNRGTDTLTRGQLAKRCAVNFETIRYYEQQGLIPAPSRTASNYRLYGEATVQRIGFIKRSQELGFTLNEVRELLSLRAMPGARCAEVLERAEAKVRNIDEKIRTLKAMRRALAKLMSECARRGGVSECPILDALEDDEGWPLLRPAQRRSSPRSKRP